MSLTEKLLLEFGPDIRSLTLVPSGGGIFEVRVGGDLVHSKAETDEFPEARVIVSEVQKRLQE